MNEAFLHQVMLIGVDVAILVLLVEGAILGLFRWRTGRGLPLISILLISLSGLGLLVALKAALMQAASLWIGIGLTVGGLAHAIDLLRRIKQHKPNV